MPLYKSPQGHQVFKKDNNIVINFSEPMNCYSTSQLNGGIQALTSCFNHQLSSWVSTTQDLPQGSINEYFRVIAQGLDLEPHSTTGLMTTASMKNAAILWDKDRDISIFGVITAGTGVNAVRAGDPPSYYEESFNSFIPIAGTINILLVIEAYLPLEALARVPIIVAEAKAAVLQDLGIKSRFSSGIATGTGTDGLIIACHHEHPIKFSDTGNHSTLGYLISRLVMKGIKESLTKEALDYKNSKSK